MFHFKFVKNKLEQKMDINTCIACSNYYVKRRKSVVPFYLLPDEVSRRNTWLEAVGRSDLIPIITKGNKGLYKICESHFDQKHVFRSTSRKYLHDDAFPTLNLYTSGCPDTGSSVPTTSVSVSKITPSVSKIAPSSQKIAPSVPTTSVSVSKITPSVSKIAPSLQKIAPSLPKLAPAVPKVVPSVSKTVPPVSNALPLVANTIPLVANTVPMNIPVLLAFGMNTTSSTQIDVKKLTGKGHVTTTDHQKLNINRSDKGWAQLVKWREQSESNQCSEGFMLFALSLYKLSPIVYQFMKNTLNLPAPIALQRFMLPLATELDPRLVNGLKLKVNTMTSQEKICSISIDFITVKEALFYNISNDRIIGLHEINGLQKPKFAKYAIVMMARGILVDWQQPIAHCFLADNENDIELIHWVEEILTFLLQIGLNVRAFVTDHRSNIVTPRPRTAVGSFLDSQVAEHEICRMYDAPRLIERMRKYLQTCEFKYKDDKILTTDYLENKINSLAKILNFKAPKWAVINNSLEDELQILQLDFLKQMIEFFKQLRLKEMGSGNDVTASAHFVLEFQVTINSVLRLREIFKSEGINFRLTSRLNLDATNKFFEKIMKNRKSQPTCRQVSAMFRKTFSRYIMNAVDQNGDLESLLQKVEDYPNVDKLVTQIRGVTSLAVGTSDYIVDLPEMPAVPYISKYIYWKCLDRHSQCANLNAFLSQSKTSVKQQKADSNDSNVMKWTKTVVPDFFIDYIFYLEKKFQDYFCKPRVKNVGNDVYKSAVYINHLNIPCGCFPFDYASKLFVRIRIYHTIKANNKLIKEQTSGGTAPSFTVPKLSSN